MDKYIRSCRSTIRLCIFQYLHLFTWVTSLYAHIISWLRGFTSWEAWWLSAYYVMWCDVKGYTSACECVRSNSQAHVGWIGLRRKVGLSCWFTGSFTRSRLEWDWTACSSGASRDETSPVQCDLTCRFVLKVNCRSTELLVGLLPVRNLMSVVLCRCVRYKQVCESSTKLWCIPMFFTVHYSLFSDFRLLCIPSLYSIENDSFITNYLTTSWGKFR